MVLMIDVIVVRYVGSVAYLHPTASHILLANFNGFLRYGQASF